MLAIVGNVYSGVLIRIPVYVVSDLPLKDLGLAGRE